ncbi:hypothetical protein D3C85_1074380 [compost metagenome]
MGAGDLGPQQGPVLSQPLAGQEDGDFGLGQIVVLSLFQFLGHRLELVGALDRQGAVVVACAVLDRGDQALAKFWGHLGRRQRPRVVGEGVAVGRACGLGLGRRAFERIGRHVGQGGVVILDLEDDPQGAGVFRKDVGGRDIDGVVAGVVVDQALVGCDVCEADAAAISRLSGMIAEGLGQRAVQFIQGKDFRHFVGGFLGALGRRIVHGGVNGDGDQGADQPIWGSGRGAAGHEPALFDTVIAFDQHDRRRAHGLDLSRVERTRVRHGRGCAGGKKRR